MARSSKRRGRENALQVLYQMDRSPDSAWEPDTALQDFFINFQHAEAVRAFTTELVQGVASHRAELDSCIEGTSTRWRLSRMSSVDRNLLRLCAFELKYQKEAPVSVVINEAVEIAKRFGTETSPSFVNGILDEIARQEKSRSVP